MPEEVGELLSLAANRAASKPNVPKAVAAAWSTLHARGADVMSAAFAAWCRAENFDSHPSELGEYLRRHYSTPEGVADSLRRAAEGGT
jgi:hypothetical protein